MYISLNLKKRKDARKLTGGGARRDGGRREYRFPCGVYISYTKGVEAGDYGLALNASDQISRAPILQVGGKKYSQEPFTYPKLLYKAVDM